MSAEPTGTVASLWRYPVKSMQGEECNASAVTEAGLVGDRAYALIDVETGKLASAKHPRKWAQLLEFRATFVEPPGVGESTPPVRIECPDGSLVRSDEPDVDRRLSAALGREVRLASTAPEGAILEEWWPDEKGGEPYGAVFEDGSETMTDIPASFAAPAGTFFDFSAIHVLTTSTLDGLRKASPESRFETRRFRPNVMVEVPGEAFVEAEWDRQVLRVGDLRLKVIIPTPRCVMTTLPQADLPNDLGILRAAAEHNRIRAGGLGELPCAGVYAAVVGTGHIRRGDPVHVEPPQPGDG